jgi:hypothetical protein
MRHDVPHRRRRKRVDVADLRERDQLAIGPRAGLDALAVDPLGRRPVAADLQVLAELLVSHRAALGQQQLDLLEHQRVALDRSRVMRLLEPDPPPDAQTLSDGMLLDGAAAANVL